MGILYKKLPDGKVQCLLCPHNCKIAAGRAGICGARKSTGSEIVLDTYGIISGYSLDPVEKKPLYHFFPGHNILSAGSFGCNMRCDFCQNYNISQGFPGSLHQKKSPEQLVLDALSAERNIGLAFTYNEPSIWFEFMRDAALSARKAGMHTVMVSNGFVNPGPMEDITGFIDGFNIDLKAFNNNFYRKLTGADIEPVKEALKIIAHSGRHLEITTLVIPGQNDDKAEMASETEWIARELGNDVPFHLSRYYPNFKRSDPATSSRSIEKLAKIASENLLYVYSGNMNSGSFQNTKCPQCGLTIAERAGYTTRTLNLDDHGNCTGCGSNIFKNYSPISL